MPICPRCGKSLSSDQALTYHLNRKYKCGTWKCHKCHECFDTKFALNIHTNQCNPERKYVTPSYDILLNIYLKSKCLFLEIDSHNIIHTISPNCKEILGYQQKELIGKNYQSFIDSNENKSSIAWISKHNEKIKVDNQMLCEKLHAHYVL
tara:strand:+ start:3165 stop:3614 length:450 start_codon:yes stop_codon:yes gene_type:complete